MLLCDVSRRGEAQLAARLCPIDTLVGGRDMRGVGARPSSDGGWGRGPFDRWTLIQAPVERPAPAEGLAC